MGRKATVVRTETTTDDEDRAAEALEKHLDVALFSNQGSTEDETIDKVHVLRADPDEGYLGYMEATATELDVFQRWGGSKFYLEAKNERGRIITRRTLKLAGDPIFMSEVYEARWRKSNGLKPKKAEGEETHGNGMSASDLMAIVETKAAELKRETEAREERRRAEDATREEKNRREEREWRAQQEKDRADREERNRQAEREHQSRLDAQRRDDDKRREDRIREDEQRREKDHERQMQATLQAAKESQEKNQQFFTNMLAMAKAGDKASADPMAQVTQILTLVEALKGAGAGEPQDAVSALLSRLPETLQAAGAMVGGAIREAKGLPAGGDGGGGDEDAGQANDGSIKLTGAAAAKTKELVMHLVKNGHDPEKALVAIADHIMGKGKKPNAAVAAARTVGAQAKPGKGKKTTHARGKVRRRGAAKSTPGNAATGSIVNKPTVTKPAGAP